MRRAISIRGDENMVLVPLIWDDKGLELRMFHVPEDKFHSLNVLSLTAEEFYDLCREHDFRYQLYVLK